MHFRARFIDQFGSARRACRAASRTLLLGSYRLVAASGVAAFAASITGCYTYAPRTFVEVSPRAMVAAQISDVGRVALAEPIGSGVERVEGQVVQNDDGAVRLMVSEVRFLSGVSNKWQGQELTLRPQDVRSVGQRTFSRQRTIAAVIIGALAAGLIFTAGFSNIFSGDSSPDKGGGQPPID